MNLNERLLSIPPERFKYLIKYSERSSEILGVKCTELIHLPYWLVKVEIPGLISDGNFVELINAIIDENITFVKERKSVLWKIKARIAKKRLKGVDVDEVLPFCFWVRDSVKKIVELEKDYLTSQPDADLLNAGIDTLNEVGELNVIDILANGDILKWEQVKKLPYEQVFDKLRKNKLEGEVQKRLTKIQKEKSKRR